MIMFVNTFVIHLFYFDHSKIGLYDAKTCKRAYQRLFQCSTNHIFY